MIFDRHRWLLRDTSTCFDADGACRVCRTQECGEVRVVQSDRGRHLANHRREKLVRDPKVALFEAIA